MRNQGRQCIHEMHPHSLILAVYFSRWNFDFAFFRLCPLAKVTFTGTNSNKRGICKVETECPPQSHSPKSPTAWSLSLQPLCFAPANLDTDTHTCFYSFWTEIGSHFLLFYTLLLLCQQPTTSSHRSLDFQHFTCQIALSPVGHPARH